jgi:hypothetical protein
MRKREEDRDEDLMWREFGLRNALAHMPSGSPGRAVIESLLARGTLAGEASAERVSKSTPAASADFVDRLERLGSLHERGQLTDQEFEAAKRKLLE